MSPCHRDPTGPIGRAPGATGTPHARGAVAAIAVLAATGVALTAVFLAMTTSTRAAGPEETPASHPVASPSGSPAPAAVPRPSAPPTATAPPRQDALGEPTGLSRDAPAHAQSADVGDCYLLSAAEPTWGMGNVELVDCLRPHHGQLVARTTLHEPVPIDVDARPSQDRPPSAVDFAVEFCVMKVWLGDTDGTGAGYALYFPVDLVHDGWATEVMCARETLAPTTGSVVPR